MEFIQNLINNIFNKKPTAITSVGPNNFAELLKQFDAPPKIKTQIELVNDVFYKEKFAELELDFLKNSPDIAYQGSWRINNSDGTSDIDFVPCLVRPEVLYCSYGKN